MYLELKKVCKSFDTHKVVDTLDLSIEKGEIVCLLGPSGCGKTTTLKMIGGFLEADTGHILVDGEDITKLEPEVRPVSTVFQSYALFPHMTVLENVIYGLKYKKIKKKEAVKMGMEYLEMVGLLQYASAKIHEISGGQRQRVALARALVVQPKILLLDEPLSNLDAKLRVRMREEIKELQQKFHITTVFVTHDQEEAMSIADKIAIMHEGKIVQIGKPEDVYLRPANAYVRRFIGEVNEFEDADGNVVELRPEQMCVSENGQIRGEILHGEFRGFYRLYYVRVGEHEIIIRCGQHEQYEAGSQVGISVCADGV